METTGRPAPVAAVAALALAATWPMSRLFEGGIIVELLAAIGIALGLAALSRRYRFSPFADLLLTVGGLGWFIGIPSASVSRR